ncbi:hypothetical protein IF2G_06439 [Cordyceps javanica]|nr:hypothetical protein IF2G_06439 [Cordyceps javanica]
MSDQGLNSIRKTVTCADDIPIIQAPPIRHIFDNEPHEHSQVAPDADFGFRRFICKSTSEQFKFPVSNAGSNGSSPLAAVRSIFSSDQMSKAVYCSHKTAHVWS